jgi:polysaccharide biosynthesis protein PslH
LGLSVDLSIVHARYLFTAIPINMGKFQSQFAKQQILAIADRQSFDLVQAEHLHMLFYGAAVKDKFNIPLVLREHNIESKIIERLAATQTNPLTRSLFAREASKAREYEARGSSIADLCMTITPIDDRYLKTLNPQVNSVVIPAGVDHSFSPLDLSEATNTILFNSPLNWQPNIESLTWFLDQVMPKILVSNPDAKLWIIGRNPPPRLIDRYTSDRIEFLGYVDDIQSYMARATVIVAPIQVGSGIRIKILNALAMGKAIVSTSIGCEGISVQPDLDIKIADSPSDFAHAVTSLLNDRRERDFLGNNAKQLIETHYRWEQIALSMETAYRSILTAL